MPPDGLTRLRGDEDLTILGNGVLVQPLMRRGLVDEFLLTVHPLVLGSGRPLFPDDGGGVALKLVGVLTARYQLSG